MVGKRIIDPVLPEEESQGEDCRVIREKECEVRVFSWNTNLGQSLYYYQRAVCVFRIIDLGLFRNGAIWIRGAHLNSRGLV